ncbi:MAG TPA: AraC family transcriptional regulator [Candidatus Faecalibacterium intestinigallinarum]|uniref:AraC family transcriptional regulator n=1 Tax=Candidatus Faecalibacterium intestinigallinarum TaxID=2838581 RepID=A0A9D1TVL2_9FIRM|nr:AraC family transcriptional regulator [Candidatus Faecalibacterium intestinigallinarum]
MKVEISRVLEKLAGSMNIGLTRVTPPFAGIDNFDYGLRRALDAEFDWPGFGRQLLDQVPEKTLVFAQGVFELRFALFLSPDEKDTLYCFGPWADGPRSSQSLAWCEKYLDEKAQRVVEEYYNRVRQVEDNTIKTSLFAVVSLAFPEGELKTAEWREFMPLRFRPSLERFRETSFTEQLPAELIAERYAAENKMLEAVAKGDVQAALAAYENFHQFQLAPRLRSPLREFKNYTIILNSLFRKAIEQASVHPYYLDHISARFALELETLGSVEEGRRLRVRMVKEYCRYVQQYSLRQYSPLIQKVINEINLHLDAPLSLKTLAAQCYISPSYLSNVFKQETGQTLTDYISRRRMERAARLLLTTNARVAVVAEEVGILDVNYFTKMFKNATGQTPTAYRRDKRAQASLEVAPDGAAPLPPAAKNGKN